MSTRISSRIDQLCLQPRRKPTVRFSRINNLGLLNSLNAWTLMSGSKENRFQCSNRFDCTTPIDLDFTSLLIGIFTTDPGLFFGSKLILISLLEPIDLDLITPSLNEPTASFPSFYVPGTLDTFLFLLLPSFVVFPISALPSNTSSVICRCHGAVCLHFIMFL